MGNQDGSFNFYDEHSPKVLKRRLSQSRPKCKQKKAEPKTYFCPYKGYSISGVAARNCNSLYSLETFQCEYQETCVAKEGLEQFAQSQAKCIGSSLDDAESIFKRELLSNSTPDWLIIGETP